MLFRRILIANRGEIAVRIINTCKELNIETVAVYSDVDHDALHVKLADHAVCIGPAYNSYTNIKAILSAATLMQCDAIHPGIGFLSENAHFAEMTVANDLIFIGPTAQNITDLSYKLSAKTIAEQYGLSVLPGSQMITDADHLKQVSWVIGYPMMIKNTHSGGGKGIKIVRHETELEEMYNDVKRDALAFDKNSQIYVEKYLENVRHIEFQFCLDKFGNCIHLYDRDCSVQRNYQKIWEEAPSCISDEMREDITEKAKRMLREMKYVGVGTLEFLIDTQHERYYFMEMNTRLQVEHTITEEITGVDLVRLQLIVAAGQKLPYAQEQIQMKGYAIECRINAEHACDGCIGVMNGEHTCDNQHDGIHFRPSLGKIVKYQLPTGPGVRVDSALYQGYDLIPHYDSLLSKLIVYAPTREQALQRAYRALSQYIINGPKTLIPLHQYLCQHADMIDNNINIHWLEDVLTKR